MEYSKEVFLSNKQRAFIIIAVLAMVFLTEYFFAKIWDERIPFFSPDVSIWLVAVSVLIGVVIHELLHGLIFSFYASEGFRTVSFRWLDIGPSCHCSEPLRRFPFMLMLITPNLLLGIMPLAASFVLGFKALQTFGLLMAIGGFYDLYFFVLLLSEEKGAKILDHPEKPGYYVIYPEISKADEI